MFLGQDILKVNGKYEPVLWKEYEDKMETYQGEILNKKGVEDKFREKIKRISRGEDIKSRNGMNAKCCLNRYLILFANQLNKNNNWRRI